MLSPIPPRQLASKSRAVFQKNPASSSWEPPPRLSFHLSPSLPCICLPSLSRRGGVILLSPRAFFGSAGSFRGFHHACRSLDRSWLAGGCCFHPIVFVPASFSLPLSVLRASLSVQLWRSFPPLSTACSLLFVFFFLTLFFFRRFIVACVRLWSVFLFQRPSLLSMAAAATLVARPRRRVERYVRRPSLSSVSSSWPLSNISSHHRAVVPIPTRVRRRRRKKPLGIPLCSATSFSALFVRFLGELTRTQRRLHELSLRLVLVDASLSPRFILFYFFTAGLSRCLSL